VFADPVSAYLFPGRCREAADPDQVEHEGVDVFGVFLIIGTFTPSVFSGVPHHYAPRKVGALIKGTPESCRLKRP
jgi:hypothetical protein